MTKVEIPRCFPPLRLWAYNVLSRLYSAGGVAQLVKCLLSVHEALSSIPSAR